MYGVEDKHNWYTEETEFKTTWTMYRWLPKKEHIINYYDNDYRFSPDTTDVLAWAYRSTNGSEFDLVLQNRGDFIELEEAVRGIAFSATAILAASMLSF